MSDCSPEILLAQFVLEDEKFSPGDNLEALVSRFATVDLVSIPFSADGISIKPKSLDRPRIVINSDNPSTRQKFTLAHELGHVLIPWHVGTICSHIDGTYDHETEYYHLEGEANRFASELLVPTAWVKHLFSTLRDPARMLKEIVDVIEISPLAATIKVMQCLPPGFLCAESHPRISTQYHRSPGTVVSAPYGDNPDLIDRYDRMADGLFALKLRGYTYRWWFFSQEHQLPIAKLGRPWREALSDILDVIPTEERTFVQQSLNGIISAAHQRHADTEEAYRYIVSRIRGAEYASYLVDHPEFQPFVMARLEALGANKKRH